MNRHPAGRAVWLVIACCAALAARVALAETTTLRTMSFNVRYAGTADGLLGTNGWYNILDPPAGRRFKAQQVIEDFAPDILGTQELLYFQLADLAGETDGVGLTAYDYYGVGRNDGASDGEFAAIFYRADRFTRLDQGTFWLSNTPEMVGSQYPGAGDVRIASWVVLDDHASGQQLFVLNTHLDNASSAARNYAAGLIDSMLPSLAGDLPILLTGDMNATETSTPLQTLLAAGDPQLLDAYREVHPVPSGNERTFHDFAGGTSGSRIDFVLHTAELTPYAADIIHTTYDGKYPSDHYPVTAEFTLEVVPEPSSAVLAVVGIGILFAWSLRLPRLRR